MTKQQKKLVGTREGASHFGVTQETLRKWIREGRVPGYQVGSRIKIDLHEAETALISALSAGDA